MSLMDIVVSYVVCGVICYAVTIGAIFIDAFVSYFKHPDQVMAWAESCEKKDNKQKWYVTALLIFVWPYNVPCSGFYYCKQKEKFEF